MTHTEHTRHPADPAPLDGFPVERTERLYASPWCGLRRDVLRLPDGRSQEYHVVEIPDAVVVVPELSDGRLVLIWQYRHPHGGSHWEVPAGRVHAGESPEQAARRELREETGYVCEHLVPLGGFYPINGISDHFAHAFAAKGCTREGETRLESAERLTVHVVDADRVRRRLLAGELRDGFTALALFHHFARAVSAGAAAAP